MNSTQSVFNEGSSASEAVRRLDTIAWAAFFTWVGVAMLIAVPWGWFLLGLGILTLAAQFVHWQIDHKRDRFWVPRGVVFLVGGVWMLLQIQWPLAPILIILLGVALLAKAVIEARGGLASLDQSCQLTFVSKAKVQMTGRYNRGIAVDKSCSVVPSILRIKVGYFLFNRLGRVAR